MQHPGKLKSKNSLNETGKKIPTMLPKQAQFAIGRKSPIAASPLGRKEKGRMYIQSSRLWGDYFLSHLTQGTDRELAYLECWGVAENKREFSRLWQH